MSYRKRRISLLALMGLLLAAVATAPASALGAFGSELASFKPEDGYGSARGLATYGSTAFISQADSSTIYVVNLATHQTTSQINTTGGSSFGFGALALDPQKNLWAAEYTSSEDMIDVIQGNGTVEHKFDATTEVSSSLTGIDGLAIDSEGAIWLKGEGEGASSTEIWKVDAQGNTSLAFTAQFGASGIAVDGEHHLWLANTNTAPTGVREIAEFEENGHKMRAFPLGKAAAGEEAEVVPEGVALDHCTFPGKLAIWTFAAEFGGGPLVAYEIEPYSGSTSDCPPLPAKKEEPAAKKEEQKSTPPPPPPPPPAPKGVGPSAIGAGPGSGGAGTGLFAGGSLLLHAADPADPSGLLFTYLWEFGDGSRTTGHGTIAHVYRCAGIYRLAVTDIDTTGARHTTTGELAVAFPRSDNKVYRGIRFSPHVHVSGHKATLWLSWSGKGKHLSARSIDWKLDNQHGKRFGVRTHAVGKVALHRDHFMTATARFSNGHSATIKACFYA